MRGEKEKKVPAEEESPWEYYVGGERGCGRLTTARNSSALEGQIGSPLLQGERKREREKEREREKRST